ncbi:hypothetical protein [Leuconostoc mesenteroides]|uniref:hypothetical protein n=1 Tax=Leuconostoc mesenteroides TaxID=1245 RepID=UPI000A02244A|nr:hypothetical protein [Leuconostoc mesenteroides]
MRNYLNINAINKNDVLHLIQRALALKSGEQPKTKSITAVNLFFENSTRTHSSIQMAENQLNWKQIQIDPKTCSMTKGESLVDTLKTLKAIGVDVAVIRHSQNSWYENVLRSEGHAIPQLVNAVAALRQQKVQVVINTTQADDRAESDGRLIRNAAIENAVPLFTALDTVSAFLEVLESRIFTVKEMH